MKYGVDVSDWQENVDWQGLLNNGYTFAIIKLGERNNVIDTLVDKIQQAREYGFQIGLYYYSHATTEDEAIQEADFVAEQINAYLGVPPELGIWYDFEEGEIVESGIDCASVCRAWVNRMNELGINNVGIYSSYNYFTNYIQNLEFPLWVAQYNCRDDYSLENPDAKVKMWQFTDRISDELPYDGNFLYDE